MRGDGEEKISREEVRIEVGRELRKKELARVRRRGKKVGFYLGDISFCDFGDIIGFYMIMVDK